MSKVAPFGSWKSPITSELYASAYVGLSEGQVEDGTVYWNELRPKEQGRYVVVQLQTDGKTIEITPPGFNTRTRVHEYGGGSYLVDQGTISTPTLESAQTVASSPISRGIIQTCPGTAPNSGRATSTMTEN